VVMPAGDRDHIGCFTDQVKLTRALVRDLDEAVKEVKLLGEYGEEASWKITELEPLCKNYAKDVEMLREEKTKLEGMVESHDELIMEFTDKYGYNCSDEDANDEDEDDNDRGGDAAPPTIVPPPAPAPPAATPEEIVVNEEDPVEIVPEQEEPEVHDVVLADAEPELSPSRMMDDLDDSTEADYDVDE
jgi:hypothetical protein